MTKRPQSCKKRIIYIRRLLRSDTLIIKKSSKKEAAHVPVFKGYLVKKITKAYLF
jgi:Mg2+ and Co2+ transporter CorA